MKSFLKPGQSNIFAISAVGSKKHDSTHNPSVVAKAGDDHIYEIYGNLNAEYSGVIDVELSNARSYLTGWACNNYFTWTDDYLGEINVNLKNGAVWNLVSKLNDKGKDLKEKSFITTLTLNDGILDMAYASRNQLNGWEDDSHRQVLIVTGIDGNKGIVGNGGTICMDVNLEDEGSARNLNLDQIIVHGTTAGTHKLAVNFINGLSGISSEKLHSDNWLIEQKSGSMTLTGPNGEDAFTGRGMVSMWQVRFVPEGEEARLDTDRESLDNTSAGKPNNGKGHWYLIRHNKVISTPEPDPDTPPVVTPPEVTENINMGTSSGQALAYLADLEDLRKRLGEVRYGAQDGGWVKVFTKKDSVNARGTAGFKQETNGLNIGFDRLVDANEDHVWLLGGAFRYSKADQDGIGVKSTTGKLYEYSFKSYATWMSDNGSYADLVAQVGRYEQKLDGLDNTGNGSSHASYNTVGYGLSAELGHMLSFGESVDDRRWYNHFYVEPQIQLSYFHVKGQDYTTSTGLEVSQGDADFLTGRAGVVLGKKFNYGTIDDLDRRYFQVALLGGVKHEFLGGDQTISYTGVDGGKASVRAGDIDGTRFYYGVNCDWQVTDNFRLYAQANREEGDRYTKDYDISIGGKLLF